MHRFMISLLSVSFFFLIFFLDVKHFFSFSDVAFIVAICTYVFFINLERYSSKFTFILTIYFVLIMGVSYLQNGFDTITERIGEWFYIFFAIGLIQYSRELKDTDI